MEKVDLLVPPLEELAQVLSDALRTNFANVDVQVVECPNLQDPPWNLVAPGLCGQPRVADVGGVDNLHYVKNNGSKYKLDEIARMAELPDAKLVIGPAAGSSGCVGLNCELVANVNLKDQKFHSVYAAIPNPPTPDSSFVVGNYPHNEVGVLANLLLSDGLPGKVLQVRVSKRNGEENFVSCMRAALMHRYGVAPSNRGGVAVALGGAFQILNGEIKGHVMPDFPGIDLLNSDAVDSFLKFFHMHSPLTCLSVFVSNDVREVGFRLEHTHFFSDHAEVGHYHYDLTPDSVEYWGYFIPAEKAYRIGKPLP